MSAPFRGVSLGTLLLVLALLLAALPAAAQDCTNPEGALGVNIYNTDHGVLQLCTPKGWASLHPPACPLGDECPDPDPCHPSNSPSPGALCSDGTIYAGLSPDGNARMFTTPADAGVIEWNNGNTAGQVNTTMPDCNFLAAVSCRTGRANTSILVSEDSDSSIEGIQPHRAARYCHCLGKPLTGVCADDPTGGANSHGHSDWYLPAKDELNVLYLSHTSIGAFDLTGHSPPTGQYWSSSENGAASAHWQRFDNAEQSSRNKSNQGSVRCVRASVVEGEDGLIGHWKLDETSGIIAGDSSGNQNIGTLQGTANFGSASVQGRIGQAVYLDGLNSLRVGIPDNDAFDTTLLTNEMTISLWTRIMGPSPHASRNHTLMGQWGAPNNFLLIHRFDDQSIRFMLELPGGDPCFFFTAASGPLNDGLWHHIVATKERLINAFGCAEMAS